MIEHWGGHGLLHVKSVILEYLRLIFLPKYFSFTIHRLKAFQLRISECGFWNYKALSSVLSTHRLFFLLIPLLFALCATPLPEADAVQVTLGWDSNSEPDLEGYVIYRNAGSPGPPYDYSGTLPEDDLTDPLHPKITLTGLNEGQDYYIALTAYNTEGVESSFSNDVCVEVVDGSVGVCANSSNSVSSNSSNNNNSSNNGDGGFGRWDVTGCFISTAGDDSSTFSKFIAKPVIRSQVLALVILLLVLIVAVKFGFNRNRGK